MDPIGPDGSLIPDDLDVSSSSSEDEGPRLRGPQRKRARGRAVASFIRPGERVCPRSAYVGSIEHTRGQTAKPEVQVLESFLADEMALDDEGEGYFTSYVLDDFLVYRNPDIKPFAREVAEDEKMEKKVVDRGRKGQGEYELPSAVYISSGVTNLLVDGILRSGEREEVLHGVAFETLSLGNIATPTEHDLTSQVWIQSLAGKSAACPGGVWYEFGTPAKEYARNWEAFEWLALLVKYVSDALEVCVESGEKMRLRFFEREFIRLMNHLHGRSKVFQRWHAAFGKDDFRIPVTTHVEFLWSQLHAASTKEKSLRRHLKQPLWGEILPTDLTAVRPAHPPSRSRKRCVVTSYVGDLFQWIFDEGVEVIQPHHFEEPTLSESEEFDELGNVLDDVFKTEILGDEGGQTYWFHHPEYQSVVYPRFTSTKTGSVTVGSVVELKRDHETKWKKSTQRWYAYVTDAWTTQKGVTKLKIIWLYWPEDVALCMSMKYPFYNELFFSDHCECGKTILLDEVVRKVAVEFFCLDGNLHNPEAEFFIRQKYHTIEDNIHISTLTPTDLSRSTPCPCRAVSTLPTYMPGEYVLLKDSSKDRLQPFRFEYYENDRAWVRQMERRREVDRKGKLNELIWTEVVVDVSPKRILRKCRVVRVAEGEEVPRLADWNGCCDWFFYREGVKVPEVKETIVMSTDIQVTIHESVSNDIEFDDTPAAEESQLSSTSTEPEPANGTLVGQMKCVMSIPPSSTDPLSRAVIPDYEPPLISGKLRGLDLFCGGGNFGRGVADGGAVIHKAVDIDINAIHSYRANLDHDDTKLYLGSINNFLYDVITKRTRYLPQPGDIEFIVAGSPCQGFSNANPQGHEALKSLSNSALVCTTLSAIDLYRPKYAILENVPAMASDRKYRGQDVNVSNQIMCALIGMGYQCRCLLLDAWHFGAPQSRTRLFIEIAAPGCVLPEIPQGSHEHHPDVRSRAVGKTATNIKFAERNLDLMTAFPPVKVSDYWDDLPDVGCSHLSVCIPFPDHKTYWTANTRDRLLASHIPSSDSLVSSSRSRYSGYQHAVRRKLIPDALQLRFVPLDAHDQRFTRLSPDGLAPTVTCVMTPPSRVSGKVFHYSQDRPITNLEAKRAQGFFDSDVIVGKAPKAFRIIGNSVCRQVAFALGHQLAEAVRKCPDVEASKVHARGKAEEDNIDYVHSELGRVKRTGTKFMVLIESRNDLKRGYPDLQVE